MTSTTIAAVRAAERQRCAAMLANDVEALDGLLASDLQFSHATGAVDDKAAYMAKLRAGRITYALIAWREVKVKLLGGDAALMTGRMLSSVRVEAVEKRLDNRVMCVWTHQDGSWRLAAFQSTPLKT